MTPEQVFDEWIDSQTDTGEGIYINSLGRNLIVSPVTETYYYQDMKAAYLAATERAARMLEAALEKYGEHKPDCEITKWMIRKDEGEFWHIGIENESKPKCTCGYEQALRGGE